MRIRRLLVLTISAFLLATGSVAAAETPPLPPLTQADDSAPLLGKFVWADLSTDEIDKARDYYERLFDWELRWVTEDVGARYGIFFKDDLPVAGLVFRAAPDDEGPYGDIWRASPSLRLKIRLAATSPLRPAARRA